MLLLPAEQDRDRISLLNQPCTVKIPDQWLQLGPSADQFAIALGRQTEEEKLLICFLKPDQKQLKQGLID